MSRTYQKYMVNLPVELVDQIDDHCLKVGAKEGDKVSRSAMIRRLCREGLRRNKRQREAV